MKAQPFVVTPQNYPQALNVVGEQILVLASGEATGGYEIFIQQGPEGSGPPPHFHPWDETYFVTRGEIVFGHGGQEVTATPGTLVHLPAGTTHWFRFGKGGGATLSMTSRAGASKMYADFDREIEGGQADVQKLVGIGARHGLTVAV